MTKFIKFNANPFSRTTKDCVIRSLVAATAYGYRTICDMVGATYIEYTGNTNGVPFGNIEEFAFKYGMIKDYDYELSEDADIPLRELDNFQKYNGFSLGFWMDYLKKKPELNRMVFLTKINLKDDFPLKTSSNYHMVYGNISDGKIYDLADPRGMIVIGMYTVDNKKRAKKDDPKYFKNEEITLKKEFQDYLEGLRNKRNINEESENESHPECHVGIYVNEMGSNKFLTKLLTNIKKVETRPTSVWNRMKKLMGDDPIGQAILLIGNKQIVGYGILEEIIPYKNRDDFFQNKNVKEHFVTDQDMWKDNNPRVGLRFSKIKKLDKPIEVNSVYPNTGTRRQGYISSEDFVMPVEIKD